MSRRAAALRARGRHLIAAAAVGVWWLLRQRASRQDRALETLRERYARGEITREEFEARRRDLAA